MRTARVPGDTHTLQSSHYTDTSFSSPFPSPVSPLTMSQINTRPSTHHQHSSHFVPPRPLSQPFSSSTSFASSVPITSPQPTGHALPPRPSSSSSTFMRPRSPTPTLSPNHSSSTLPSFSPSASFKTSQVTPNTRNEKTEKSDDKGELVALLSRTSQTIASKSAEMENIRKQLQATEQRLRNLQRDKEEMDALRKSINKQ